MRAWFHTLTDKSDNFFHSRLLPGCALAAPINLLSTPTASQSQQKYQPRGLRGVRMSAESYRLVLC